MTFDLDASIAVLHRTPAVLSQLLRGVPDVWTTGNEGPDTWSPYDVVGHLLHGERTDWIPRARTILEHGAARTFAPFDRTAQFRESVGHTLHEVLDAFAHEREDSLATLRGWQLTAADLTRVGRHPAFGDVTLAQLLATWTAHDLSHLTQITRVMAKQYRDAVGPWRAYLSVLRD